jgi:hypothetical protein
MTPEEIAREIVEKWLVDTLNPTSRRSQTLLEERIAAALAASEQRVRELEDRRDTEWRQFVRLTHDEQIAVLEAQLQASEQENETLRRQYQQDGVDKVVLHSKLQASERALVRVRDEIAADLNRAWSDIGNMTPMAAAAYQFAITSATNVVMSRLAALASPGSPQEKGN